MSPTLTRADLLRAALGGGAIAVAGAAAAAPSKDTDADVLRLFLLLELLQQDLYRGAAESRWLSGELRSFVETTLRQEEAHAAFLTKHLGGRGGERPRSDFGTALRSPEAFRSTAVELEEAALAVYVGQGANLTARLIAPVAAMVSVEARQAAWVRDLAGMNPAPKAADPARKPGQVLGALREKGYLR